MQNFQFIINDTGKSSSLFLLSQTKVFITFQSSFVPLAQNRTKLHGRQNPNQCQNRASVINSCSVQQNVQALTSLAAYIVGGIFNENSDLA